MVDWDKELARRVVDAGCLAPVHHDQLLKRLQPRGSLAIHRLSLVNRACHPYARIVPSGLRMYALEKSRPIDPWSTSRPRCSPRMYRFDTEALGRCEYVRFTDVCLGEVTSDRPVEYLAA